MKSLPLDFYGFPAPYGPEAPPGYAPLLSDGFGSFAPETIQAPPAGYPASTTDTDTTNFNRNLSAADDTVQKALDTLDDLVAGGWPDAGKAMINSVEYADIPTAVTAVAAGDIIKAGQGTHAGQVSIQNKSNLTLRGLANKQTVLSYDQDGANVVWIYNSTDIALVDLKIVNTGAGINAYGLQLTQLATDSNGLVLRNLIVEKTTGAPTTAAGVVIQGGTVGGTLFESGKVTVTSGTNKYAVLVSSVGAKVVIGPDVELNGATADIRVDHADAVVELRGCKLLGGGISVAAGTVRGWYINSNGDKVIVGTSVLKGSGSNYPNLGTTTLAEKLGNIYQAPAKDIYPSDDRRGIATRFINPIGVLFVTDHFRSGSIPASFAWQGAPFDGTPSYLNYSASSEYLMATAINVGNKIFLSKAVTNSAAAWQNTGIYVRCAAADNYEVGVRIDDGTDNNFLEAFMVGLGNATQRLDFRYKVNPTTTTINSGLIIPATQMTTFVLYVFWDGANYAGVSWPVSESGNPLNAGLSSVFLSWMPAAGRVGVFEKGVNTGGLPLWDWFYNTMG
jgi:hypothetical protein